MGAHLVHKWEQLGSGDAYRPLGISFNMRGRESVDPILISYSFGW